MNRFLQLVAVFLVAASPALRAQKQEEHPAPALRPGRAPRMTNPATIVQRLMRMTPEQRERAIEKLPPDRQTQLRERLAQFDSLPKPEQERRLQLGQIFASLPLDKQEVVRRQIQAFNQLPDDRRREVASAFQRLRRLRESEREVRMAAPAFRNRFTPSEQQMLADLSQNLPPPAPVPSVP